jgi:hypothetical protein
MNNDKQISLLALPWQPTGIKVRMERRAKRKKRERKEAASVIQVILV